LQHKTYELSNHLGNVLATITDRKVPNVSGTSFTYYNPQITTITDYYPFGMQIEERSWVASSSSYRFGFNGQEKENDISGNDGDYLSFTYRIHDVRLGRFLSVDPLAASYPWNSTYAFAENRVIDGIDLEGDGQLMAQGALSRQELSMETFNKLGKASSKLLIGGIVHEIEEGFQYQVIQGAPVFKDSEEKFKKAYLPAHKKALIEQAKAMGVDKVENDLDIFEKNSGTLIL